MIRRGDICWADLGAPSGSGPAKLRPVLVVSADEYNQSRIGTAAVLAITSNTRLGTVPGNVFLPASSAGLERDSVVNVTAVVTVDKADLGRPVGRPPAPLLASVDRGLRQVLRL